MYAYTLLGGRYVGEALSRCNFYNIMQAARAMCEIDFPPNVTQLQSKGAASHGHTIDSHCVCV